MPIMPKLSIANMSTVAEPAVCDPPIEHVFLPSPPNSIRNRLRHDRHELGRHRSPPRSARLIKIKKGLDIPIAGKPRQHIDEATPVSSVAVTGPDYVGMKPTMSVDVGDRVKAGQILFFDKKNPGVCFTSPGCGKVTSINRGAKRAFQSIVIQLEGDQCETFPVFSEDTLHTLGRQEVVDNLVRSGMWTSFRTRPFSRVPSPEGIPNSIFVTAIDTSPLAADPEVVILRRPSDFVAGLKILDRLNAKHTFLCKAPTADLPGETLDSVETVAFSGPHPAGLPGTHIHFLDPVGRNKTAWHINYQDVMAIGRLILSGKPDFQRVVSLAGPAVERPRLIRTRIGANLTELVEGELIESERYNTANRLVSGSLLSGRAAAPSFQHLGRYHLQISALSEIGNRELFGWIMPGFKKYSLKNVVASKLTGRKSFSFDTSRYGGHRAIVPIGMYEKVMPMDILPTFLFRSLSIEDLQQAEWLGCLELDEEDLALCTFCCPGKGDYGAMLRRVLTTIEKEG